MKRVLLIEKYQQPTLVERFFDEYLGEHFFTKHWKDEFGKYSRKYGLPACEREGYILEYYDEEGNYIYTFNVMTYENQIEEIIKNFDFKKVNSVMTSLDWSWFSSSNFHVPSIYELKQKARKLLLQAIESGVKYQRDYFVSTGGFKASFYIESNSIKLQFILESFET